MISNFGKILGLGILGAFVSVAACNDSSTAPPPAGSIAGKVTIEGRGLERVTVSLSNGTFATTTTGGSFRFDGIAPGTYKVSISGYPAHASFVTTAKSVTFGTDGGLATVAFGARNSDRDALVALYNATSGAGWTKSDNWLTDAPIGDWYGITTDASGRVTSLWLQENNLRGTIPPEVGGLIRLQELALFREPGLTGPIPRELGNLADLELLALGGNDLTGAIPPEIGNLTDLTGLYLWSNRLTGAIPRELGKLTRLEALQLDGRDGTSAAAYSDATPVDSRAAAERLMPGHKVSYRFQEFNRDDQEPWTVAASRMSNAGLTGRIPAEIGRLTNLTLLTLGHNRLTGGIPPEIGNLTKLEQFSVENNQLTGTIPAALGRLTDLTFLAIDRNRLTGSIPPEIGNLRNLGTFWAPANDLSGSIPPGIGNLSALRHLGLHDNSLTGNIPRALGNLTSLAQLVLSRNRLVGMIPPELGDLASLEVLLLNQNRLDGGVPPELGDLNGLVSLSLRDNELTGPLPADIGDLSNLVRLWVYRNPVSGPLPLDMTKLGNLSVFNFSETRLCVPDDRAFVSWLSSLQDVTGSGLNCGTISGDRDVLVALYHATDGANWKNSTNWLTDAPLDDWYGVSADASESVVELNLGENNLVGPIPSELGDLANLKTLVLIDPGLTGPIPGELGSLANLETLGLAGPGLTGSIPRELGRLASLETLILAGTALTGSIPRELANLADLTELMLFENELTGPIPSELGNLGNLTGLALNGNALSGSLPSELGNLSQLEALLLQDNLLTAPVPDSFLGLGQLQALSIARNNGLCFPDTQAFRSWLGGMEAGGQFCQSADRAALVALFEATGGASWKDNENWLTGAPLGEWAGVGTDSLGRVAGIFLESNNLVGTLPPELGDLARLEVLHLGDNQLTDRIPDTFLRLERLEHFYFWLNDGLCAPNTDAFTSWLSGKESYGPRCGQQGDYAALLSLYDSTGGTNWTSKQDWLTAAPLGDWYGVTTDASGRVSRLVLQENNLTGSIPPELGNLDAIVVLHLYSNSLEGPIPDSFLQLRRLDSFVADSRNCVPATKAFKAWLEGVELHNATLCNAADKSALMALYNSAGGTGWTRSDNWGTDAPLNDWFGVTADGQGQVTRLILSDNNLAGAIPPNSATSVAW